MATTANPPPGAFAVEDHNGSDPFISNSHDLQRHRYSAFDNSQFSLYLNGSPSQAKRALQAHLSETTRRLQETSQLGNALVQQRKELEEKLKEVEKQQEDNEIGPELRQRLAELEKEFNEVGRETVRTFLPKSRVPSGETDTTAGASVYSSEAHHSPSKVSVPSRKQRNQQPNRINDIALATEISTSLLNQLKDLQAVLLEKDDALKAANLDRSQLEIEVEGLSQRLRATDESESRLKDVNWSLETQVREFEAATKAAADREHRLNHNLSLSKSEKSMLEREFEELKQLYAKISDEHVAKTKQHETELSGLRRNVSMGETERGALQRKVDELASQNQELARAVAYRLRSEDQASVDDTSPEDGDDDGNTVTPDHSPPPSPSKATPRHGQLESETLKHSLHHAHRMIQQLKNNIHREKTEKIELKRMLQDARDELESNRNGINGLGSAGKRKKIEKDVFKKPTRPDRLGALRTGSQEIVVDDDEWEEQDVEGTPSRRSRQVDVPGAFPGGFSSAAESSHEEFETSNDTSDAFETANERDGTTTETDAFQTGAETLDGDSTDELTETEGGPSTGTIRGRRPSPLSIAGNRNSYQSTASTSGDEADNVDIKTPVQTQQPRYRLKIKQGGYRRATPRSSEELFTNTPPAAKDSPASFVGNSNNSTPAQGKSLFAELGNLSGESEDGSVADGTPSRSSLLSPDSSPEVMRKSTLNRSPLQLASVPQAMMVDSGMMTEPWPPTPFAQAADLEQPLQKTTSVSHVGMATEPETPRKMGISSISMQDTQPVTPMIKEILPPTMHISSLSSQDTVPEAPVVRQPPLPALHMSQISTQGTNPVSPVLKKAEPPSLNISSIAAQTTEPREPLANPKDFSNSLLLIPSVSAQATEPLEPSKTVLVNETSVPMPLHMSSLSTQNTEPVEAPMPACSQFSMLTSQATEPAGAPRPTRLQLAGLASQATEPAEAPRPARLQLAGLASQATEPVEPPARTLSQISSITVQHTEPIEPAIILPPANRFSDVMVLQNTQPESPTLPAFLPSPSRPSTAHRVPPAILSLSNIVSQETEPHVPSRPVTAHRAAPEAVQLGFFNSVLPWGKNMSEVTAEASSRSPLAPIASNAVQTDRGLEFSTPEQRPLTPMTDEGTQTMVTADQIDKVLATRSQRHSGTIAAAGVEKSMSPPSSPRRYSDPSRAPRRPGSSGSIRSRDTSPPPLPPDHKQVIAAAALKSPTLPVSTPSTPGVMGPPGMPASAYKKRPMTPVTVKTSNGVSSPKMGGTTPRPRHQHQRSDAGRSGATSPISRRSSVSSFVSEIDQRFNISSQAPFGPNGFDPASTDPRMIQAITQTMIGEFLWKYTRKAGREGMSENRHRRFFWVHPYTRTLYWSEKDPATAGRSQLKAKSVAIEAVQVVSDDNPYPPGLHRKSLVVITPGRTVKFTATTGQRHETWFNALSYLLLRTGEEQVEQKFATDEIQNEFNPGFRSSSRQTGRSRASLSSHVSRRTSSPHHAQIPTLRQPSTTSQRASSQTPGSGRFSSLSGVFRPSPGGIRSSFSSRHSKASAQEASTYGQSEPSHSAEDLTREMMEQRQRDMDRLEMENVRACCDGKHDVASLTHKSGRHTSFQSRPSLVGSMSSRSHSRAESHGAH
ncbi:uncharacterized protein BDR25DRAFT_234 [Lindgomyces ingoldianus]|uniref:Uncharacterized protein n=1 Tax=Lindgomyces ingoldianus TaxID=673940 RepID=A0ACB6RDG7_9PLEO|nr:uncharacterized protein BDR25DRAFT_234 [Lindgomyces ingoldianus]KAF2477379.1 hypothetical protein BDR25DRAFT_234 [Lindgomyces ingoldianus]